MSKMEDIDLINYIINKGKTAQEAADYFGVSLSTVKKRLAFIKSGISEQSEIYQSLQEVADKNALQGRVKGGQALNSGVHRSLSLEEIVSIAVYMLANDFTIEQAARSFNIPGSTLFENLQLLNCENYRELYQDLQSLYEAHKLNKDTTHIQLKYSDKMGYSSNNEDNKIK